MNAAKHQYDRLEYKSLTPVTRMVPSGFTTIRPVSGSSVRAMEPSGFPTIPSTPVSSVEDMVSRDRESKDARGAGKERRRGRKISGTLRVWERSMETEARWFRYVE